MHYWRWNNQTMREWERVRARGYRRFLWVRGVFLYGCLWMMICVVIYRFIQTSHLSAQVSSFILGVTILVAILGPVSGYFFHRRIWQETERSYLEERRRSGEPAK